MSSLDRNPFHVVDVVVVGGGLSGLCAAGLLHKENVDVLVLEAQERVGGRLYTIKNDKVKYLDLGGAFIGPTQNRVLRVARELGVKNYLVNDKGKSIFYSRGRRRVFDGVTQPMVWPCIYLEYNHLFRTLDKMAAQVPVEAPWKAPKAQEWDKMTVQQFFQQHVTSRDVMFCAKELVQLNMTAEPYEVSLLWFLWYLRSAGGILRINGVTQGAQERKFVGGSMQLCEKIVEQIGPEKVKLNTPVCFIEQTKTEVIIQTIHGQVFKARTVILAIPPPLQNRITFNPPLPTLRNQLIQRMPMGKVIKTFMFYEKPFWREKGFNGLTSIDAEDGIVGSSMEDVKVDGSYPAIMAFILADKALGYSSLTKEERKTKICLLYRKVFDAAEALSPIHYEEKNWCEDQWCGGCYTAMMPPGFLTTYGSELRRPLDRLYFAGTETATEWTGYMDGAVQAGERAAREILHAMGKLSESEIWQDEAEDPDVKAEVLEFGTLEKYLPPPIRMTRLLSYFAGLVGIGGGLAALVKWGLGSSRPRL